LKAYNTGKHRGVAAALVAALVILSAAGCATTSKLKEYQAELDRTQRSKVPGGRNGLALSIHPRKQVFEHDEPVLIDVRLTNVTNATAVPADINVYTEIATEGLLLYLDLYRLDDVRKRLHQTPPYHPSEEKQLADYPHYVTLQPGFTISRPLQFADFQPGIYELTVRYDCQYEFCRLSPRLSVDDIAKLQDATGVSGFVRLWRGTLHSNTVVFEVLEPKEK